MNHAFQLAARAVFLSNNCDIEKFSFELPYVKPNTSVNSVNLSVEDSGSIGKYSNIIIMALTNDKKSMHPPFRIVLMFHMLRYN